MKSKNATCKSSESLKTSQSTSKPSSASKKPKSFKTSSTSILEQVYRLPPSLKRTEVFIKNSIDQQRLSSRIVDLVGSTFRLKNQSDDHISSPSAFESYPPLSKGSNLSDTLETLYEEDAESSRDSIEILYTDHSMPDDFAAGSTHKVLDASLYLSNLGVNSYSSHDLHRENTERIPNSVDERIYSTVVCSRKESKTERLSSSPIRERSIPLATWTSSTNGQTERKKALFSTSKGIENRIERKSSVKDVKQKVQQQYEKAVLQETQKNLRSLEEKIERLKGSSYLGKGVFEGRQQTPQVKTQLKKPSQGENKSIQGILKSGGYIQPLRKVDEKRKRSSERLENSDISRKTRRSESNGKKEVVLSKSVEKVKKDSQDKREAKRMDIITSIQQFDRKVKGKSIERYKSNNDILKDLPMNIERCRTEV